MQKEFDNIPSLHFIDDTLLFYTGKMESVLAITAILLALEGASSLCINFHKNFVSFA